MEDEPNACPAQEESGIRVQGHGSEVLLWGMLPQTIIVKPNIETLQSTI